MSAAMPRRRVRIKARAIALVVLVGALLVASVYPLRTYLNQRSQITSLERQAQQFQKQDAALHVKIRLLHQPDYLERLARECLGMVMPGEIAFVIAPTSGNAPLPSC